MIDKIEPAVHENAWIGGYHGEDISLSPARVGVDGRFRLHVSLRASPMDSPDDFRALIAFGNAALPDSDPRKITREKVKRIRAIGNALIDKHELWDAKGFLLELADALESYLPPE